MSFIPTMWVYYPAPWGRLVGPWRRYPVACCGECASLQEKHKEKSLEFRLFSAIFGVIYVELLSRFELETASLPRMEILEQYCVNTTINEDYIAKRL